MPWKFLILQGFLVLPIKGSPIFADIKHVISESSKKPTPSGEDYRKDTIGG